MGGAAMTRARASTSATFRASSASATGASPRPRYAAAARPGSRRGAGLAAHGAGHDRGHALQPPPTTALQVAFTAPASRRSASPRPCCAGFSPEFLAGMTDDPAARDGWATSEPTHPQRWAVGRSAGVPHLLVMFFASRGRLDGLVQRDDRRRRGRRRSRPCDRLGTADLDEHRAVRLRRRHQPAARSTGTSGATVDSRAQVDYGNVVALGEFLLGYATSTASTPTGR